MTKADLDRVFDNTAMKKRTKRFAILGMSLSNLIDIHQPQDLLKGLLNVLTEYDQAKEENDKRKMVPFIYYLESFVINMVQCVAAI